MNISDLKHMVWRKPIYFLAFGFGTGLMPFAPGTWGTLAGVLVYLVIMHFSLFYYSIAVLFCTIFGIAICGYVANQLKLKDYPGIVWDEVVGYLLTLYAVPPQWQWMGLGFILFRIFDIWKPWPIRWVDRKVEGGLGIMLDDILAALPACLCLHLIIAFSSK